MKITKNKNHDFLKTAGKGAIAIALVVWANIIQATPVRQSQQKPNIILILTDDQGWTDTAIQMMPNRPDSKSEYYRTPNLERLAREGMCFSNAYSPTPVCSPTRTSIQFGKTAARLKNTGHYRSASKCEEEIGIAQMVKAGHSDYVTAHFGKWGLKRTPQDIGYDVSDGFTNNFHGDWRSTIDRRAVAADDPKQIFAISRRANNFMEKQVKDGRPFFMQISHYALHVQHRALKSTIEKYRNLPRGKKCRDEDYSTPPPPLNEWMLEYAAMIENMDSGIGMVMDKINQLGISENTYIIFTSDNGGSFRGNGPLRGEKGSLWEGGIRVPTVARGPGIKAGSFCDVPVVGWDLFPTINDLIGNKNPLPEGIDGGSWRTLFENEGKGKVERKNEGLVFHFPYYNPGPQSAIRMGDYKLIKDLETDEFFLYNLVEDIGESNNLTKDMPVKAGELYQKLMNYLKAVDAERAEDIHLDRISQLEDELQRLHERRRELVVSDNPGATDEFLRSNLRMRFIQETKKQQEERWQRIMELKKENSEGFE